MSQIETLYQKHREEKNRLYRDETCLSDVLENVQNTQSLYNQRIELLEYLREAVTTIINYHTGDITIEEEYTIRDGDIFKFNTSKQLSLEELVREDFTEPVIDKSKNPEKIKSLFEKLSEATHPLRKNFVDRNYYTLVKRYDGNPISIKSKSNHKLALLYRIKPDFQGGTYAKSKDVEISEEKYFRTFRLITVKKDRKSYIINPSLRCNNYYTLHKPEKVIDEEDMKRLEHYSDDMLFVSKRALTEIRTEVNSLIQLRNYVQEEFETILIANEI